MKIIKYLFFLIILFTVQANAQFFLGGIGSGFTYKASINDTISIGNIYSGGIGSGFVSRSAINDTIPLSNIYTGGVGSGFYERNSINDTFKIQNIYSGGVGSGFIMRVGLRVQPLSSFLLTLHHGWNMKSINIVPEKPLLDTIFHGNTSSILVVKNDSGKVYIPSFGNNQIGNWDIQKGYLIYSTSNINILIFGVNIPYNSPVNLSQGWNLIPYYPANSMVTSQAISGLSDNLVLMKNSSGNIYFPFLGINQINNTNLGEAYWVYSLRSASLIY